MDQWCDADDDIEARPKAHPQGKVASQGLGGFVRSSDAVKAEPFKIEVVASKKERVKKATDLASMPPPPPKLPSARPAAEHPEASAAPESTQPGPEKAAGQASHGFKVPAWAAGQPPAGASLQVTKGDTLVQQIPLMEAATVFGRHISADVVCDHPSLSRLHAAICFQRMTGACMVLDLGSTHGTFVNGERVDKAAPVELKPGAELRFAASTRCYVLQSSNPKRLLEDPSEDAQLPKRSKQPAP